MRLLKSTELTETRHHLYETTFIILYEKHSPDAEAKGLAYALPDFV